MRSLNIKNVLISLGVFLTLTLGATAQTWVKHSTDVPPGCVLTLYANGTNIYAGTYGEGVFFTTNNGTNWSNIKGSLPNTYVSAVHVVDTNLFVGTGYFGVYRSNNNGVDWSAQNAGLSNRYVQAFANFGTRVFAGTRRGGVFRTINNAASWVSSSSGLPSNCDVRCLVIRGTVIFAGTDTGIYSSVDSGATWTESNGGLPSYDVTALLQRGGSLYTCVYGSGVHKSTNGGRDWTPINSGLTSYNVTSLCSISSNLYVGTEGSGVFLTTNDGAGWNNISSTISNDYVNCLLSLGNNVFAGTLYGPGGGVCMTADNNDNWQYLNSGFSNYGKINSFVVAGTSTFAGGEGGIAHSTNNGLTWTIANSGMASNIVVNSLNVKGSSILAGTDFKGLYISTNNGGAWVQANNGFHLNPIIRSIVINGPDIFIGSDTGMYVSTNNGGSWSAYSNGLTNKNIYSLTFLDTVLFAGTSNAVYKSMNRGTSWVSSSTGLPSLPVNFLLTKGINVFASVEGGGVFMTSNGGQNWTGVNSGLGDLNVRSLYSYGSAVFTGTLNGVFVTVNNGDNWTYLPNTGLTNNNIQSLGYADTTLLAGTIGGGVFHLDLSSIILTGTLQKNAYCTTNQLQVPVLAIGTFNAGNIFTAELSDTIGNFGNPISIGTLNSIVSGNITATIPPGVVKGTQYRIRVKSTNPVLIAQDNQKDFSINPIPTVTLSPFDSVCASAPAFDLTGGLPAGGSYTGLGVSLGKFNPATVGPGLQTITYTYNDPNGCSNSASRQISVLTVPFILQDSLTSVCVYAPLVDLTVGVTPTGGVFSGNGVSNGKFNPTVAGAGTHVLKYSVVGSNGCSNTAFRTIKVNPKPSLVLSNFQDVCVDTPPFDIQGGFPAGGTYSGSGVISNKFYPALSGIGNIPITYRFKDANGCEDSISKSIHVYPIPQKPTITRGGDELAASSAQTYKWYYKDEVIPGATTQYFKPDKIGFYKVEVQDAFGCSALSDPFYFSGTAVHDVTNFEFGIIYPNPSKGIFNIKIGDLNLKELEINVKDILGNSIYQRNVVMLGDSDEKIDISSVPSGIYILEIIAGEKRFVGKIVKNNE